MSIPSYDSVKEQIREAIDIVELVSRYVPLRRQGYLYVGRCPWHDDSRPSLQINPQRQTWKCWVCNIGGDIFSFVMQIEKVDFKEALEILADRAGIAIPKQKKMFRLSDTTPAENDGSEAVNRPVTTPQDNVVSKRTLFQAMQWAAERYHQALLTLDEAEPARKYLKDRGITDASVKQFLIGYAPLQRDWWLKQLKGDRKRIRILETVGILARRQEDAPESGRSDQPYDRFRGRVLFPIRDTQDRTVAFGGRVLPNSPLSSKAKYVNSPETPLFSKHRMLYGLDIARLTMGKSRRALMMEGYTDCIMAHQYGFSDAVAVLGTALGAEHIRVLKRFADRMLLVLDGDEAGRRRADEVLELFVAQGVDMAVLTLPDGNDPCEFLEHHGAEALEGLIEHEAVDALEHAFQSVTRGIDLENDVIGSSRALDRLLTVIVQAPAKIGDVDSGFLLRLEKIIQRLAQRFAMDEGRVRNRIKQLRAGAERRASRYDGMNAEAEAGKAAEDADSPWNDPRQMPDTLEREMMELWLADPTTLYDFWESVPEQACRSPITRAIYRKANELLDREKLPTLEMLLVAFDDPRMKSFLVDLDESGRRKRMVRPEPSRDVEGNTIDHPPIEQPYSEMVKRQLTDEIVAGFKRRGEERQVRLGISRLRNEELSSEERRNAFAAFIEEQKKKHRKNEETPIEHADDESVND